MLNCNFYIIIDTDVTKGRDILKFAEEALKGGVDIIQLRAKNISDMEHLRIGQCLRALTERYKKIFIVNDRVDIAYFVKADGVHLGQKDIPIDNARMILGKDKLIGVSCRSLEEALAAQAKGADYIGIGPIFRTSTKLDASPIGPEVIENICKNIKIPAFAIGGIDEDNVKEIVMRGAGRIAFCSAVSMKDDVCKATMSLKNKVENYKKEFFYL